MKRPQIIFNWLISYLGHIVDSEEGEKFAESLSLDRADDLANATDILRGRRDELRRMRARRSHYAEWSELRRELDEFHSGFSDFPGIAPNKASLTISLAKRAAELVLPLDGDKKSEIDTKLFELRILSKPLPIAWFAYTNSKSFKDSTVVIGSARAVAFDFELSRDSINERLFFYALAALRIGGELAEGSFALVKRLPKFSNEQAEAFVSLVVLANGICVHTPRIYAGKPKLDVDAIVLDTPYQQMNESMYVLSEYNSHNDLLTKFLTAYHVVENFMYKLPIVELEAKRGGRMFSIRNFRTLYESVAEREEAALKKFFRKAFEIVLRPGAKFGVHLESEWARFASSRKPTDIVATLSRLDIDKKAGEVMRMFSGSHAPANLADIIYRLRNAVVHNKETELHLTYAMLDGPIIALLEEFLLLVLEELCFGLVIKKNALVWYSNRSLSLY